LNDVLKCCQFNEAVVLIQITEIIEPCPATSNAAECYDPAFLLPLFSHLLAPGKSLLSFRIILFS